MLCPWFVSTIQINGTESINSIFSAHIPTKLSFARDSPGGRIRLLSNGMWCMEFHSPSRTSLFIAPITDYV